MAVIEMRCASCHAPVRAEQASLATPVRCPACSPRATVPVTAPGEKGWFYAPSNRQKLGPVSFT